MGDLQPIAALIPGQLELAEELAERRRETLVRHAIELSEAARDLAAAAAWGPEMHVRSEVAHVETIAAAIRAAAQNDGGTDGR